MIGIDPRVVDEAIADQTTHADARRRPPTHLGARDRVGINRGEIIEFKAPPAYGEVRRHAAGI